MNELYSHVLGENKTFTHSIISDLKEIYSKIGDTEKKIEFKGYSLKQNFYKIQMINHDFKFIKVADEIVKVDQISSNQEIYKKSYITRLKIEELITEYYSNRDEDQRDISNVSKKYLQSSLIILQKNKILLPELTINPSGLFQARWEKDRNNKLVVVFLENGRVDFLEFHSSIDPKQTRSVRTGNESIKDFLCHLLKYEF